MRARPVAEGILKFTETQTVALQRLMPAGALRWMEAGVHAA
jgi:hypothetical protein